MSEIIIREATICDAAGIARVNVDTWRTAYRGIVPDEHLAGLSHEKWEARWAAVFEEGTNLTYVAQDIDGMIVGFTSARAIGEPMPGYRGEIPAVYVLQAFQRQGVGRKLVAAAVDGLLGRGIDSMVIWVLADNPCRAFYEKLGGTPVAEKTIVIGGKPLREIAYGWRDVKALAASVMDGPRGRSNDRESGMER